MILPCGQGDSLPLVLLDGEIVFRGSYPDPAAETEAYRQEVMSLVLLDAAEAYHREVLRQGSAMPEFVKRLLPRLREPAFTRVLLVTLPEATPVHEARRLQEDLARARITPFAWVVNQSFTPVATSDPVLSARRRAERRYLEEVRGLSARMAVVSWFAEPPRGSRGLGELFLDRPKEIR